MTDDEDDYICCECGQEVPPKDRMDHPKDPDAAWIHTNCPEHLPRRV